MHFDDGGVAQSRLRITDKNMFKIICVKKETIYIEMNKTKYCFTKAADLGHALALPGPSRDVGKPMIIIIRRRRRRKYYYDSNNDNSDNDDNDNDNNRQAEPPRQPRPRARRRGVARPTGASTPLPRSVEPKRGVSKPTAYIFPIFESRT